MSDKHEKEEFKVVFEHWGEESISAPCDFCKQNAATWWCEFLVEAWCDECMADQKRDAGSKSDSERRKRHKEWLESLTVEEYEQIGEEDFEVWNKSKRNNDGSM